jgi:hypothetical protein
MPVGFQVFKSNGTVQIDDQYRCMSLVEKRVVNIAAGSTSPTHYAVSATGNNVLVACRTQSLQVSTWTVSNTGTSWTTNFLFLSDSGTVGEDVIFYIFSEPEPTPVTFGLEVYNAAGQLCFSSDVNPLKVAAVVGGTSGFSGAAGRIYAPIILTRSDDITFNNNVIWNIRYWFMRCAGNTISATPRTMRTGPIRRASNGTYLVADVTGY